MVSAKVVGAAAVKTRILMQFEQYDRDFYEVFKYYAGEAMLYFMSVQGSAPAEEPGMFWTNHTFGAVQGFFAKAFQVPGQMGITFANTTWYAELLENDYGGRFASFPTLVDKFVPLILADLKYITGDKS